MRRAPARPASRHPWRRPFGLGFLVGVLLVVPGVLVALLVPFAETVWPLLTPGAAVLRPLAPAMATWPGGLNVLLTAVVNGLVVGAVVAGAAALAGRARR